MFVPRAYETHQESYIFLHNVSSQIALPLSLLLDHRVPASLKQRPAHVHYTGEQQEEKERERRECIDLHRLGERYADFLLVRSPELDWFGIAGRLSLSMKVRNKFAI